MTISNTNNRTRLAADGAVVAFDFTFRIYDESEILVYDVTSAGVATLKTITSHYTVSIDSVGEGGTVTFLTAPANGNDVLMLRDLAYTQTQDIPINEGFTEEVIETGLDRIVVQVQQLKDTLDRAVKVATTSETDDLTFPEPSADKLLGWNAAGDDLENKVPTSVIETLDVTLIPGDAAKPVVVNATEDGYEIGDFPDFGAEIPTLTAKTTPVNADLLVASDSAASDEAKKITFANLKLAILEADNPIGTVRTFGVSTNPATLLGFGTWTAIEGKVIVGKAASGTFDTLNEVLGAETITLTSAQSGLPAHGHTLDGKALTIDGSNQTAFVSAAKNNPDTNVDVTSALKSNSAANASEAHSNLQPSITKYIWQRTA